MIPEFLTYLKDIRGYAPNTIRAYKKDLTRIASYMSEQHKGIRWSTMTREDIDGYIIARAETAKPSTTNRELASLGALYRWMKRQGYEVANPVQYESRRKIAKTQPNTIPISQLRTAYDRAEGIQRPLLGLLISTGMRIGEVLSMRWEDIDFDAHAINVRGKGSKERTAYTTAEVLAELKQQHDERGRHGKIWHIAQREARRMVWQALTPYCTARQLSPHAIRHTMATHMATEGENVATIAQTLGHKRLETTQKYIDLAAMRTREAAARHAII